jgi:hypothetical protein
VKEKSFRQREGKERVENRRRKRREIERLIEVEREKEVGKYFENRGMIKRERERKREKETD